MEHTIKTTSSFYWRGTNNMGAAADDNNNTRCVWTHEETTTSLGKPKWATEAGTSRETETATRQPDATIFRELLVSQCHLLLVELHLTEKGRRHLLLIPMIRLQTCGWSFPFAKFMKYLCRRVSDCCENKFEQTHFCNQRPVMREVGFISVTALKLKDCVLIYVEKLYRGGGAFHNRCRQEVLESLWKSRQNMKRRSYFSKFFFFLRRLWATYELHKETHDLSADVPSSAVTHGWLTRTDSDSQTFFERSQVTNEQTDKDRKTSVVSWESSRTITHTLRVQSR